MSHNGCLSNIYRYRQSRRREVVTYECRHSGQDCLCYVSRNTDSKQQKYWYQFNMFQFPLSMSRFVSRYKTRYGCMYSTSCFLFTHASNTVHFMLACKMQSVYRIYQLDKKTLPCGPDMKKFTIMPSVISTGSTVFLT